MSITRQGAITGVISRGPTLAEADLTIKVVDSDSIVTAASTQAVTIKDSNYTQHNGATVDPQFYIIVHGVVPGTLARDLKLYSSDPAIAAIDNSGLMTRASGAPLTTAPIRAIASTLWISRTTLALNLSQVTGKTTQLFDSFVSGSVAATASSAIDTLIAGLLGTSTEKLIRTASAYNSSCWAASLDLTGVSVNQPRLTLVSPRHVIGAEHYQQAVGSVIQFLAADGTVVSRTLTAKISIGPVNNVDFYATDVYIGVLDSDVPASIKSYLMAPSNLANYLPGVSNGVPALCLNGSMNALVHDVYVVNGEIDTREPTDATRYNFYETIITGDSSNPVFILVGGNLVLMTQWTFGGAGSGSADWQLITAINTVMTSLGGGYQITVPDWSSYLLY